MAMACEKIHNGVALPVPAPRGDPGSAPPGSGEPGCLAGSGRAGRLHRGSPARVRGESAGRATRLPRTEEGLRAKRRSLALLRHPSPARSARFLRGLLRERRGRRPRDGRGGGGRLAVRFAPPAHAAVCVVDGTFSDSPVEPSSAPGSLRRDVPPEL
ncbi:hypothetical protein J1605_002844 [Eschrichtius robustus]|uniref:Uncharacterized protein n=1 Tax=Eschrichtius robustus TaxID=9764 RepID=A0AB34HVP0_ESCRO|nr:hypothetical protein J1605_002844 [Eschrichtius robustus]